jgi:hypothetical protein
VLHQLLCHLFCSERQETRVEMDTCAEILRDRSSNWARKTVFFEGQTALFVPRVSQHWCMEHWYNKTQAFDAHSISMIHLSGRVRVAE